MLFFVSNALFSGMVLTTEGLKITDKALLPVTASPNPGLMNPVRVLQKLTTPIRLLVSGLSVFTSLNSDTQLILSVIMPLGRETASSFSALIITPGIVFPL